MRTRISTLSTVQVGVPVSSVTVPDLSGLPVELAFLPDGVSPTVWTPGVWETITGQQWALALVGPESDHGPLTPGRYWVWVRVIGDPEIPVDRSRSQITVF